MRAWAILAMGLIFGAAAVPEAAFAQVTLDLSDKAPDQLSFRDPFQRPQIRDAANLPKSELERFSVEQMELLGIITGPLKMRASIRTPDGKLHMVAEKQKIGNRNGFIRKINPGEVLVTEKVLTAWGKEEEQEIQLRIASKNKE